jgi:hypothetical protein
MTVPHPDKHQALYRNHAHHQLQHISSTTI